MGQAALKKNLAKFLTYLPTVQCTVYNSMPISLAAGSCAHEKPKFEGVVCAPMWPCACADQAQQKVVVRSGWLIF